MATRNSGTIQRPATTAAGKATAMARTRLRAIPTRTSSGTSVARRILTWARSSRAVRPPSTSAPPRGGCHPGHVAQHQVEAAGPGPGHHRYAVLAQPAQDVLAFQAPQPGAQRGPRAAGRRGDTGREGVHRDG